MKHIILLASIFILVGCGKDVMEPKANISPPNWIIGQWSDEFYINNFTFSSDNITFSSETSSINFKEAYPGMTEEESTIHYRAITSYGKYEFVKINSTSLNYTITVDGLSVGPLVLIKQ